MEQFDQLKKDIIQVIYQNKDGKITGEKTQGILLEMVDVLGQKIEDLEARIKALEGK